MSCYVVWTKQPNKQIRIYPYNVVDVPGRIRAFACAMDLADANHRSGTPCTVEQFHLIDVGVLVYDTEDTPDWR